jgi:hypothetical protein
LRLGLEKKYFIKASKVKNQNSPFSVTQYFHSASFSKNQQQDDLPQHNKTITDPTSGTNGFNLAFSVSTRILDLTTRRSREAEELLFSSLPHSRSSVPIRISTPVFASTMFGIDYVQLSAERDPLKNPLSRACIEQEHYGSRVF